VSKELNPEKLAELTEELTKALDEQEGTGKPISSKQNLQG
jgi:hypothetical protein